MKSPLFHFGVYNLTCWWTKPWELIIKQQNNWLFCCLIISSQGLVHEQVKLCWSAEPYTHQNGITYVVYCKMKWFKLGLWRKYIDLNIVNRSTNSIFRLTELDRFYLYNIYYIIFCLFCNRYKKCVFQYLNIFTYSPHLLFMHFLQ